MHIIHLNAYHPPEYLHRKDTFMTSIQKLFAADYWAFGIVIWEVLFLKRSKREIGVAEEIIQYQQVKQLFSENEEFYHDLTDLMYRCWAGVVNERATFKDCINAINKIYNELNKNKNK